MKFFTNVLTEKTIELYFKGLSHKKELSIWGLSNLKWPAGLNSSSMGNVLLSMVNNELKYFILEDISHILPSYKNVEVLQYIWDRNSSISLHNDLCYKFGATIYLNKEWDINDGGLFVWVDSQSNSLRVNKPEYNTMVLNDQGEDHLVTIVSPFVRQPRYTIQIFCDE